MRRGTGAGPDRRRRRSRAHRVDAARPPGRRPPAGQRAARAPPTCRRPTCSTSGRWRSSRTAASPTRSPSAARRPSRWRRRPTTPASPAPTRTTGGGSRGSSPGAPAARTSYWRAASPWRQLNLPQIRLEPILKAGAERLSPGRIRFNHELLELEQDDDGVTRASSATTARGEEYAVRCDYLLGADGGRRVAGQIGVDVRGPRRGDADRDAARERRLLALGARPRRPHPLDPLAAGRDAGRDGPDGAGALGARLRGVGDPPQLPGRRPAGAVRREGRGRRARRDRPARRADDDPQDHALVGGRGDGLGVPGRPRLPARRRGAPPPADRRARADERDPRRPEPLLEARRRARRARPRPSCSTPTSPSAARPTSATPSARSRTRSTSSRSCDALGRLATRTRRRRTGRTCAACGAAGPRTPSTAAAVLRAIRMQSMEFNELNVEFGYALRVGGGRARRQPAAASRSTRSASTSRRPGRARRCRTPGSTTRTATAGRSRTWSRRAASC